MSDMALFVLIFVFVMGVCLATIANRCERIRDAMLETNALLKDLIEKYHAGNTEGDKLRQ
jgi:hypothetical protein